jgi:hypothetical protein
MAMRTIVFAAVAAVGLGLGGCADQPVQTGSSQGQGGYLGKDAGANAQASGSSQPAAPGSGQGGYLGKDPGGDAAGPIRMSEEEMMKNPTMWCRMGSVDADRCMGRAVPDHQHCLERTADPHAYYKCRRLLDYMGWHT